MDFLKADRKAGQKGYWKVDLTVDLKAGLKVSSRDCRKADLKDY